jgi:hypothetical protein
MVRTDLTGGDERSYYVERGKLVRNNGTGKPERTGPDPDNPAVMKTFPAEAAYLTEEDNFALFDWLIRRLVISWSLPYPPAEWSAEKRDAEDLDLTHAIDAAVTPYLRWIRGDGPKPAKTGSTSAATSSDTAPALPPMPTQAPSATASA